MTNMDDTMNILLFTHKFTDSKYYGYHTSYGKR